MELPAEEVRAAALSLVELLSLTQQARKLKPATLHKAYLQKVKVSKAHQEKSSVAAS